MLLTDERAHVPSKSDDAWADALNAARQFRCPALVIDTEDFMLRARHIRLETLSSEEELLPTLRNPLENRVAARDGH